LAGKSIPYTSALVEKTYRQGVIMEAERSCFAMTLRGNNERSIFGTEDRPGNGRGDKVEVRYGAVLDEAPKTRTSQVLGQEASTPNYTDEVQIRYFLFDAAVENVIVDPEMVSFDLFDQERSRVAVQWAYNWEKSVLNQVAGVTHKNTAADYGLSGGNIVTAQDANSWFSPNGSANDAAVAADNTDLMTAEFLDDLVLRAESKVYRRWPLVPPDTPYGPLFVVIMHGVGFKQLRQTFSGSQVYDLHRAAIEGGNDYDSNPILTGQGFIYNKCLVLRSDFCPRGDTGGAEQANTFRGVFLGAQAGSFVFGNGFTGGNHLGYSEHMQHRRWSCLADTLYGFKRSIVEGESWGSMAFSHYSPV